MKKLYILIGLFLFVVLPLKAERIAPETARKVAATFMTNNGAKSTQLTDLTKAAGFANLYIFSTESSFVVMAADDCAKPILGYSLNDKFDIDDMPENMRWWLQQYSDEIQWGIENGIQPDKSATAEWRNLKEGNYAKAMNDVVVGPLIQTRWNQDSPYNMYCPSGTVTGCVATAMAQVMKYWNYPEQGQGSHSYTPEKHPEYGEQSADFEHTTYDWNNMTNTYGSSSTDAQKEAVATLMYHCGVAVNMNYGTSAEGGSSAYSSIVPDALTDYFKYAPSATYVSRDAYTHAQWIEFLKLELDEGRPLYYSGSYVNTDGFTGGHAFVCDGYRTDNYFHFNWGWGGSKDNYFAIGALNPSSGGIGSGSGSYNLNNAVAAWVEPISSLAAPIISVAASGRNIILSWDAIANASSYDVYRDNAKIASNITENTYTDSDIASGSYYDYYVRAINSDTCSNPSNFVTGMSVFRNIAPSNLTAEADGENISLSWTGYEGNQSVELHYGTASNNFGYAADSTLGTYWGQRYPSNLIADFVGMEISKVSCCFFYASSYTMYIFNGEPTEADKLCEQSHTKTTNKKMEWVSFNLDSPLQIDCSKDLWIVFYNNDSNVPYPALVGEYNGADISDAKYIATSLEDLPTSWLNEDFSWLFRVNLTDGIYTYAIYDGETKLNEEGVSGTTYTHESPTGNTIHQYTVKTNYYGGESSPSNKASFALGNYAIAELDMDAADKMIIAEGSTLTVSGTFSNSNPANLVLEDGAQLVHNSEGVKATVRKAIAGYESKGNGGWRFIASPVLESITPSAENGLTSEGSTYDLYYYDEPEHFWRNYTSHAEDFVIEPTKGYLYANSTSTTLQLEGSLRPSNEPVTIENLSRSGSTLQGFNLVGNPFACNATIDQDCYIIEDDKVVLASSAPIIAPCEGVFVKADSDSYSVTFTKATGAKSSRSSKSLDLAVSQGKAAIDRVRVRFGDGANMEKFSLNERNSTQLCFQQDGQDYAVAYADGQDEMPISFKAAENGTYTLSVEDNSTDLDYLHLIDNMTGDDIDLLATPSYSFEAKTTDYDSRFRLVFDASDASTGSASDATFAYVSNGEIVVVGNAVGDAGTASLQVVDVMGRVIRVCTDVARNVSTSGIPAGVYVLRLIDGDNVSTQKIVIE